MAGAATVSSASAVHPWLERPGPSAQLEASLPLGLQGVRGGRDLAQCHHFAVHHPERPKPGYFLEQSPGYCLDFFLPTILTWTCTLLRHGDPCMGLNSAHPWIPAWLGDPQGRTSRTLLHAEPLWLLEISHPKRGPASGTCWPSCSGCSRCHTMCEVLTSVLSIFPPQR